MTKKQNKSGVSKILNYSATTYMVECHFCGTTCQNDSRSVKTDEQFAQNCFSTGWREVSSSHYQVIALACPDCAKAKDRDR